MKIISGKYKGRVLKGFDIDGTRPTQDRIKESLFSMIQSFIPNSVCLDLFCGSGSLGIEAISNGAKSCYFVDKNKKVIEVLLNNLKDINNYKIDNTSFDTFLNKIDTKFDVVFLDPPYKLNLINKSIELLKKNNLLNEGAIIICEYENEEINTTLQLIKEKKYGYKKIKIFKNQ